MHIKHYLNIKLNFLLENKEYIKVIRYFSKFYYILKRNYPDRLKLELSSNFL